MRFILYALCLYDIYLYLPDTLDFIGIDFYAPEVPYFAWVDAAMLLAGGVLIGVALLKLGGKFNKILGVVMIVLNLICTPLFILRALNSI
jgi:hypothetical protein